MIFYIVVGVADRLADVEDLAVVVNVGVVSVRPAGARERVLQAGDERVRSVGQNVRHAALAVDETGGGDQQGHSSESGHFPLYLIFKLILII